MSSGALPIALGATVEFERIIYISNSLLRPMITVLIVADALIDLPDSVGRVVNGS